MSNEHPFARAQRPIRQIRVRDLSVKWAQSQRSMSDRKVQAIADNLDPDAFGVIAVCPAGTNGQYHIIDGQHRVAAVDRLWGDSEFVPCQVIEDASTPEEAAEIWLVMNKERSKPNAFQAFQVALTAKRPLETAVNTIIEASPFNLGKGGITAVNLCCRIYENQGGPALEWVLYTLSKTFGSEREAVQAGLIAGYALFLETYADEGFDEDRLVEQVAKRHNASRLLGAARAARETFGGSVAKNVVRVIVQCYNKRMRLEESMLSRP